MTGIIAKEDELKLLKEKQSARVMVISDSHSNPEVIQTVLSIYGQGCDVLCFCGDGIQDIIHCLENGYKSKAFAQCIPGTIVLCRGNNDSSSAVYKTDKATIIKIPEEVVFDVCDKKILVTHGHQHDVYYGTDNLFYYARENAFNVVLYGHTHISHAQTKNNITVLNPGSCSLPRGGSSHTFAILNIQKNKPVEYDYYEIKDFTKGEIQIANHTPSSDDFNFFW